VVLWKNGVNVWRMWYRDGKVTWKKLMGVQFPVTTGELHTLTVETNPEGLAVDADGMKMSVGGAWKVSSGDLASMKSAGKTPRYPCSVEFTDEATIEFDGTEFLSRDMSPYPICAFDNGKRTGTPRLVNPETLGPCWRFSVSGGMLSLKYRQPFAVILR
jgi:hypothetical protein